MAKEILQQLDRQLKETFQELGLGDDPVRLLETHRIWMSLDAAGQSVPRWFSLESALDDFLDSRGVPIDDATRVKGIWTARQEVFAKIGN